MEDAAKRRERLMAMRTEVSQRSGAPSPQPSLGSVELPDPMFSSSPPVEAPAHPPRFDYYTNPSGSFSSTHNLNKRKGSSVVSSGSPPASGPHLRPSVGSRDYTANHHPMHQLGPQSYMPSHGPPTAHWRGPTHFHPPPPRNFQSPSRWLGSWQQAGGSPLGMSHTNRPRSMFSNPSFVRDSGSSQRPSSNPNLNPYSGPRGPGGRGRGFHGQFDQRNYYSKAMVEDPWIELEPIVGNLVEFLDVSGSGSRSWLPESVRQKESKKPDKIGNKYEKKLSLAEYLDLSFNQTNDET